GGIEGIDLCLKIGIVVVLEDRDRLAGAVAFDRRAGRRGKVNGIEPVCRRNLSRRVARKQAAFTEKIPARPETAQGARAQHRRSLRLQIQLLVNAREADRSDLSVRKM